MSSTQKTKKSFEEYLEDFKNTHPWKVFNNFSLISTGKPLPVTLTNLLTIPFDIDDFYNAPQEKKEIVLRELHLFSYIAHELWKKELVV